MKLLSSLICVSSLCANALAADPFCVGEKRILNQDLVVMQYYRVSCDDGVSFTTDQDVQLPLPYFWDERETRKVLAAMSSRGYRQTGELDYREVYEVGSSTDKILIFEKQPAPNKTLCMVVKTNETVAGLNRDRKVFDADISCSDSRINLSRSAITQDEVGQYLKGFGLSLRIRDNVPENRPSGSTVDYYRN